MGQQQLLLILLGVILVAVAIALVIHMFNANAVSSKRDTLSNDLVSLSGLALSYYHKPSYLGGGGNSFEGWKIPEDFKTSVDKRAIYSCEIQSNQVVIKGIGDEIGNDGASEIQMTVTVYNDRVEYAMVN